MAEQNIRLDPTGDVAIQFELKNRARLSLNLANAISLNQLPAQIGHASESAAIVEKSRRHQAIDILADEVETEVTIPFGAEPKIFRCWSACGNHIRTVSDIRIGGLTSFDYLENDSLEISSDWKQIKILTLNADTLETTWKKITRKSAKAPLYDATQPWISIVIEDVSGASLEITTGEDLWRLFKPCIKNGTSQFLLTFTDHAITVKRVLGQWPAPLNWAQRTWRSKWHLAWNVAPVRKSLKATAKKNVWDMASLICPTGTQKQTGNGACLMASGTLSALKKKVRATVGAQDARPVVLQNWAPGFCKVASHCGRPNSQEMLHWDLTEMLQFWEWANRQLVRIGSSFTVEIPDDSPFAKLPSILGLCTPPATRD